jgi:hypothetical protein
VSLVTATAHTVSFKRMVDAYKGNDPSHPHDYSFFVTQFNAVLYAALAASMVVRRRYLLGQSWWEKQSLFLSSSLVLGLMDCLNSLMGTLGKPKPRLSPLPFEAFGVRRMVWMSGGPYCAGSVQTLLDQLMIPITLGFSVTLLGKHFSCLQKSGALVILLGTGLALIPSFSSRGNQRSTVTGVSLYAFSNVPASYSGIRKEFLLKAMVHLDVYYLAMVRARLGKVATDDRWKRLAQNGAASCVAGGGLVASGLWVCAPSPHGPPGLRRGALLADAPPALPGLAVLPGQGLAARGSLLRSLRRHVHVSGCFGIRESSMRPGVICWFCASRFIFWSFLYDMAHLYVTKDGSAALVVICSALALPITNLAFSLPFVAGTLTSLHFRPRGEAHESTAP